MGKTKLMEAEKRKKAYLKIKNSDIALMAARIVLKYKDFFLQAKRYEDSLNNGPINYYNLPWSEEDKVSASSERVFLLNVLKRVLRDINTLNDILLVHGDDRLNELKVNLLDADDFYREIRELRDPNEHDDEYLANVGRNQETFNRILETDMGKILTNAHWSLCINGTNYIGNMNYDDIMHKMITFRDKTVNILNEIDADYIRR
jgi:hypothetical protein